MNLSPEIINFARNVAKHNGNVMVVGGAVRDSFLGIESKDIDLEVFGIQPDQLELILNESFANVKHVGRAFPVWLANDNIDISLPRQERKIQSKNPHTGFEVTYDPFLPIEIALSRRDFTINSIAIDVLSGVVYDPFNGRQDLRDCILRATNVTTFSDDPLRILRAAQFIARFDLYASNSLYNLAILNLKEIVNISAERKYQEFVKLLTKGKNIASGLRFLNDIGYFLHDMPEIHNLNNCHQSQEHHAEGNVFNHTMLVCNELPTLRTGDFESDLVVAFAALCHDFGKPATTINVSGKFIAHGHEDYTQPVYDFLNRLKAPKDLIRKVIVLVEEHLTPVRAKAPKPMRRLNRKLSEAGVTLDQLIRVAKADQYGRISNRTKVEIDSRLKEFEEDFTDANKTIDVIKPLVTGKDLISLGWKPGPEIGKVLKIALDLEDQGQSREEILHTLMVYREVT